MGVPLDNPCASALVTCKHRSVMLLALHNVLFSVHAQSLPVGQTRFVHLLANQLLYLKRYGHSVQHRCLRKKWLAVHLQMICLPCCSPARGQCQCL
jgi:hypothetical protein